MWLGPPVVPFSPLCRGRVPLQKKTVGKRLRTLILTSLLEDLGGKQFALFNRVYDCSNLFHL